MDNNHYSDKLFQQAVTDLDKPTEMLDFENINKRIKNNIDSKLRDLNLKNKLMETENINVTASTSKQSLVNWNAKLLIPLMSLTFIVVIAIAAVPVMNNLFNNTTNSNIATAQYSNEQIIANLETTFSKTTGITYADYAANKDQHTGTGIAKVADSRNAGGSSMVTLASSKMDAPEGNYITIDLTNKVLIEKTRSEYTDAEGNTFKSEGTNYITSNKSKYVIKSNSNGKEKYEYFLSMPGNNGEMVTLSYAGGKYAIKETTKLPAESDLYVGSAESTFSYYDQNSYIIERIKNNELKDLGFSTIDGRTVKVYVEDITIQDKGDRCFGTLEASAGDEVSTKCTTGSSNATTKYFVLPEEGKVYRIESWIDNKLSFAETKVSTEILPLNESDASFNYAKDLAGVEVKEFFTDMSNQSVVEMDTIKMAKESFEKIQKEFGIIALDGYKVIQAFYQDPGNLGASFNFSDAAKARFSKDYDPTFESFTEDTYSALNYTYGQYIATDANGDFNSQVMIAVSSGGTSGMIANLPSNVGDTMDVSEIYIQINNEKVKATQYSPKSGTSIAMEPLAANPTVMISFEYKGFEYIITKFTKADSESLKFNTYTGDLNYELWNKFTESAPVETAPLK